VWDVEQDSLIEAVLYPGLKKLSLLGYLAIKPLFNQTRCQCSLPAVKNDRHIRRLVRRGFFKDNSPEVEEAFQNVSVCFVVCQGNGSFNVA
jgi:hypothetical protein